MNARSEAARLAAMRRRILAAYDAASADDLASGLAWYRRAAHAAGTLAEGSAVSADHAAGIIAALSPRCRWSTNVAWAARMIDAATRGEPCPAVSTRANRAAAWRIACGERPEAVLRGPKVSRFYRNLTGDLAAVTVDVWAARAAEGRSDDRAPSGRRYALLERAYREAAAIIGRPPRDVQAAVWVHVRGAAD